MISPLLFILILALVQGLCEFLPVSSSGHLALARHLLGFPGPDLVLDLTLHLGTLAAVVWFYRGSVGSLISETRRIPQALLSRKTGRELMATRPDFRLGVMIVVASVPTALIGLAFQDRLSALFESAPAVGVALLMTAGVLIATSRVKPGTVDELSMTVYQALIIGVAQGLAIAPGLSRSGLTIGTALLLGLRPGLAARFSFILSIPAIIGGLALSLGQGLTSEIGLRWLLLGLFASAVIGWAALRLLTMIVDRGRLVIFAPWCVIVGLLAIFWGLAGG
jgi:undecaprenyl-diphosphatase